MIPTKRMKMARVLWVLVLFMISSCVSSSGQNHQDRDGMASWAPSDAGPRLVKGDDPDSDALRMLEDGYRREGFSYVNAAGADCIEALEQAKAVHADIVIVYTSRAGSGYNCLASHWVKLRPPVFGVHMEDVKAEARRNGRTGALVTAVVRDSPADRAGIVRGDMVIRIGSVAVNSAAALYDEAMRLAGRKVIVEVWRDDHAIEKEVQLAPLP